jgi:hypothetical protein
MFIEQPGLAGYVLETTLHTKCWDGVAVMLNVPYCPGTVVLTV